MFKSNTLFVLGAGASYEAGFPLRSELAASLSKDLYFYVDSGRLENGDQQTYSAKQKLARSTEFTINALIQAGRLISAGVQDAESIDNYVELHWDKPAVQLVSKLGMSIAIARTEKQSRLFSYNKSNGKWEIRNSSAMGTHHPRQTWYQRFFEIATNGIRAADLENLFKDGRVLCFNYDRSSEHFLLLRVMSLYAVDEQIAARAVRNLKVVRPFGGLGALPLLGQHQSLEFGELEHYRDYWRIAENIRTYSETPGSEVLDEIGNLTAWAKQVIFLGFGFRRQNMKLLERTNQRHLFIYATTYGISEQNRVAISERLHSKFKDLFHLHKPNDRKSATPVLSSLSCAEFMAVFKELFSRLTRPSAHRAAHHTLP